MKFVSASLPVDDERREAREFGSIGGATGLMVGSPYDLADSEETESALGAISSSVQAGRTALLAEVIEGIPVVVDTAMSGVGGTVLRRPVAEVEAEIAVAEEAERKARREARKELLRSRHEHDKFLTMSDFPCRGSHEH